MEANSVYFNKSYIEKSNEKECFLNICHKILKFKYPEFFIQKKVKIMQLLQDALFLSIKNFILLGKHHINSPLFRLKIE